MSTHSGREFSKLIQRKGLMENTAIYLPKLCDWVNERIVYWQSELGSAWVHGHERGSTKSFSMTVNKDVSDRRNEYSRPKENRVNNELVLDEAEFEEIGVW